MLGIYFIGIPNEYCHILLEIEKSNCYYAGWENGRTGEFCPNGGVDCHAEM